MKDAQDAVDRELHWSLVYGDLLDGKLDSLAQYLRQNNGNIDPCVANYVASMIDGTSSKVKARLRLDRCVGKKGTPRGRSLRIAKFMVANGATSPGMLESANSAAQVHFGLGRRSIMTAWSGWKDLLRRKEAALNILREKAKVQNKDDDSAPL